MSVFWEVIENELESWKTMYFYLCKSWTVLWNSF